MRDLQPQPTEHYGIGPEQTLSEERLGGLLAAVGNHEAKALVLTGMKSGEAYTTQDLHALYEGMQGEDTAYPLHRTVPIGYCRESFEPVGAVAKVYYDTRGLSYELTEEGESVGKAVAGHLLGFSLRNPELPLKRVLGLTLGGDPELRSPLRRIEILGDLLSRSGPTSVREVANSSTQRPEASAYHINRMIGEGILTEHEAEDTRSDVVYELPETIQEFVTVHSETIMTSRVVNAINKLKDADNPITRKSILEVVLDGGEYSEQAVAKYSYRVNLVLKGLQEQTLVGDGTKIAPVRHKLIEITPQFRAGIEEIVQIIGRLQAADSEFMAEGKRLGREILSNPASVLALIEKALANSPQANGLPIEERKAKVMEFLRNKGTATAADLGLSLKEQGLTVISARKTLNHLQKLGIVEGAIVTAASGYGIEKVWSLVDQAEPTSKD